MESIIKNSRQIIKSLKTKKKRYLYKEIDFSQKMVGIVGQRGVGKTTMMIQYLAQRLEKAPTGHSTYALDAEDLGGVGKG